MSNQATSGGECEGRGGGAMGNPFKSYLSCARVWCCNNCGAHLANNEVIVSKVRFGCVSERQTNTEVV